MCGSYDALFVPKYRDEVPQIARIVEASLGGLDLDVEWLTGTFSDVWIARKIKNRETYSMDQDSQELRTDYYKLMLILTVTNDEHIHFSAYCDLVIETV